VVVADTAGGDLSGFIMLFLYEYLNASRDYRPALSSTFNHVKAMTTIRNLPLIDLSVLIDLTQAHKHIHVASGGVASVSSLLSSVSVSFREKTGCLVSLAVITGPVTWLC